MTPDELHQRADSLLQRGMPRRAADTLQRIITLPTATESEREFAREAAARILAGNCHRSDIARRARNAEQQRIARAASKRAAPAPKEKAAPAPKEKAAPAPKEKAAVVTSRTGHTMREIKALLCQAKETRQQRERQEWTA